MVGSRDKGIIDREKGVWHRRNSSKGRAGRGMKMWENTRKIHSGGALGVIFLRVRELRGHPKVIPG